MFLGTRWIDNQRTTVTSDLKFKTSVGISNVSANVVSYGATVSTITGVRFPLPNSLTTLNIGSEGETANRKANCKIKRIAIYPGALSNTQLELLTT